MLGPGNIKNNEEQNYLSPWKDGFLLPGLSCRPQSRCASWMAFCGLVKSTSLTQQYFAPSGLTYSFSLPHFETEADVRVQASELCFKRPHESWLWMSLSFSLAVFISLSLKKKRPFSWYLFIYPPLCRSLIFPCFDIILNNNFFSFYL